MIPGYTDFEFDLPGALLSQLIEALNSLGSATLAPTSLEEIPDAQGVYQLFLDGILVYIGKTDAEAGLRRRLERHRSKIQHRTGLDPLRVTFKAIRIYVFTAMDLETQLIGHYGGSTAVTWNGSGFGSNDPGRERDTTTYKSEHYDSLFPIDIDRVLGLALPATATASEALNTLKETIPYVLRFEGAAPRSRKPHSDLTTTLISFGDTTALTARQIIEKVVCKLPASWQATRLPSHIILYKEDRAYPYGERIARSE